MNESIYESDHQGRAQIESGITFGRVTDVDIPRRMVTVKTFLGKGIMDDMHIPKCQWLSLDTNPDGDETTSIPRKNTMGLVFFVNGEPFFFGGFRALNADAGAITGEEAEKKLLPGDKIISTNAGNRIVLKASRLIDIISTEGLKRTYSPKDNRIIDLCSNYQLTSDGGKILWENLGSPLNQTLWSAEYATNINRTSVLYDRIGTVTSSRIFQRDMGLALPTVKGPTTVLYTESIDVDGTYNRKIGPLGGSFQEVINPDGSFELINKAMSLKVSLTGQVTIQNQVGTFDLSDAGDFSFKNAITSLLMEAAGGYSISNGFATIEATADGDISLNASEAKAKWGKGQFELAGNGGALLDTIDQILQQLIDLTTAMATETHLGNLGYNTSPPLNAAQYATATAQLTAIKTVLALFKGSV